MRNEYLYGALTAITSVLYLYLLIILSFSSACVDFLGNFLFCFLPIGTAVFVVCFVKSKSFSEYFKKLFTYLVTSFALITFIESLNIPHIIYSFLNNDAMSKGDGLGAVIIIIISGLSNLLSVLIIALTITINSKERN